MDALVKYKLEKKDAWLTKRVPEQLVKEDVKRLVSIGMHVSVVIPKKAPLHRNYPKDAFPH